MLKPLWGRQLYEYTGGKPKDKDINPPKFPSAIQTSVEEVKENELLYYITRTYVF